MHENLALCFPPSLILCIEVMENFLIYMYFYICTVSSLINKKKDYHVKLKCKKKNGPITCHFLFESIQFPTYEYDSLL